MAFKDTLRELGGLNRNDRLERAWLIGVSVKGFHYGGEKKVADLPSPPAKARVWGYVAPGRLRWARTKAAFLKEARSFAGPRVDFEFCSQTELRAFCSGIGHETEPSEIPAAGFQPVAASELSPCR